MTTRKLRRAAAAAIAAGTFSGCATPGPLHVYTLEPSARAIRDQRDDLSSEVPSFVGEDERITGFAYDPFTDHFFLRLAPGERIRVVDRPARAIKRELALDPTAAGAGDIAVKPETGHLFLLRGDSTVIQITRLGRLVRTFELAETSATPLGIAYDSKLDLLLVASGDSRSQIAVHDLTGRRVRVIPLARELAGPLAFDSAGREFFAPLAHENATAVFDEHGKLVRTFTPAAKFIDVGPRSFIRVF